MKISISAQSTSMNVEEYMDDAKKAGDWLKKQLGTVFDSKYSYTAGVKKILGPVFMAEIYNVPTGSTQLEYLNSTSHLRFMLHLTDGAGRQKDIEKFELELIQMSYQLKNKGLKYRKISGKSPMEVCKKLFAWVEKNIDIIKSA